MCGFCAREGRVITEAGRLLISKMNSHLTDSLVLSIIVGALKFGIAVLLLIGLFVPALVRPSAAILALIMIAAVGMHAKVRDPAIRYLPASLMLVMSLLLLL